MRLVPTQEKIHIKWFAVLSDGTKMRNTKGFVHNAWEVECSCGWATHTGGAIKTSIEQDIFKHKFHDHNYRIVFRGEAK